MKRCLGIILLIAFALVITSCQTPAPTVAVNYLQPGAAGQGFIANWQVRGPHSFEDKPYKDKDASQEALDELFVKNEAALVAGVGTTACGCSKWVPVKASDGLVDLDTLYGDIDYQVAYLCANVWSPEAMTDCKLKLGSDDYIKVWLNGKLVHTYKTKRRSCNADDDTVEGISLKKGWNTLTIKCVDVVRDWGVYCRIVDAKGKPVAVGSSQ